MTAVIGPVASFLMGLSLGMIGGGGSILTVPILVYIYSVDPLTATSVSLFVVASTAVLGAFLSYRKGHVELATAMSFALPSFLGVWVVKNLALPAIPNEIAIIAGKSMTKALLVMLTFAILMVFASLAMIRSAKKANININKFNGSRNFLLVSLQGLLVGCVTGFVGAGGGFLIVPALVNLLGLDMRKAVGTSLTIIATNSYFGFGLSLLKGVQVPWPLLGLIVAFSLAGSALGAKFSERVPEKKLKIGFGYFVLIMGTFILADQIFRL